VGGSDYPFEALQRRIDLFREAGFQAAKFSSGWYELGTGRSFVAGSAQSWIELETQKVEAIQRHVGSDFILCLDGHMGNQGEGEETWTLEIAKAVLKALEEYNIFFFEEPLPYRDPHGYAELCASTRMPVAGGRMPHHF
jgi:L-alanine-DL-glutamate epimerase-like enolase superfamily enzyme